MSVAPYTQFRAVTNFNNTLLTNEIEQNLKYWARWCFLKIGAWQDVEIPSSGYYGGDFSLLTPVVDPNYEEYQVYAAPKMDLVYEEGVDYDGANPIAISGVWINDGFYGSGDASHGHYVDYDNGYVVFTEPLTSTDVVKMNYSFRTVSVQIADESPIWKEIQYGSLRVDDTHVLDNENGQWTAIPAIARQQMPCVIFEAVPRGSHKPWELGGMGQIITRDVLAHIVAQDRQTRNNITDIFAFEGEHVIWLFNSDEIVGSTDWPLDYRGAKNDNGLNYPDLIERYKWLRTRIGETVISEIESRNPYLHESTVRLRTETIFGRE